MNFAIEVPGEAAPLTLPELGRALMAANSNDHGQRQASMKQLEAWETHQNYFSSLQTAFLDKSLPHEIRFLAIILLKNGIDRYWRHTTRNSIKPAEKQLIRSRLLQGSVDEEERSLALHNALVVAKIVRIDYPKDWPDALPNFINVTRSLRTGNQMHLSGALVILLRVVKELSTARMLPTQKALQAATPELVQLLGELYTERTAYWLEYLTKGHGDSEEAELAMDNSLTALKILRRLVTAGYEHPAGDPMVQGFWSLSQSQFDQFLGIVGQDSPIPIPLQDMVSKHLIQFTKLHIQMCESHPANFPMLPNSIPLVKAYWSLVKNFSEVFEKSGGIKLTGSEGAEGKPRFEGPLSERLALKGILLIRACVNIAHRPVQTFRYRSPEAKNQEKEAVQAIKTGLLTNDFLMDVVQVIISKLFIFRKSDLEAWEEDPEGWESQERNEGSAWEWAVRPCAERLLVDLLTYYKELGQSLLTYCDLAIKVDMDVVTKEAAYCALGCAAQNIHEAFDFDRFLTTTLTKDAQLEDSMAKLLRRRISILISQWISVKISKANRPIVYEIFRHLLNPAVKHNDEVVRITAARQFKFVADDFEFIGDQFLPVAADVFNFLIALLGEVDLDETKLAILETIRVIVTRMDEHISQFGDAIMTTLPQLWESAGSEEYMIKQSILAIMSALVMSMRGDSQRYQGFMIPLLREAMDPESALHLHLIEESVDLWTSILMQSAPPLKPELSQLVELALPTLEYDSEVAKECLNIVKSYILLSPDVVLSDNLRRPTLANLARTLEAPGRDRVKTGTMCIEFMLRSAEEMGGSQGVAVIVQDMMEIGLLRTIMEGLHSAWESNQTTGPRRKPSRIDTLKKADYFKLLARVALADPTVFANLLATIGANAGVQAAPGSPEAVVPVWNWLAAEWFAAFDNMAEIAARKLSCLALTRLAELPLPVAQPLVLAHLQEYLAMWTGVVLDVREGSDDANPELAPNGVADPSADTLVLTGSPSYEFDTPLDVRERELGAKDPVYTVRTYDFVLARLGDLVQRAGGEAAFQAEWAANVDKDVLGGFQALATVEKKSD